MSCWVVENGQKQLSQIFAYLTAICPSPYKILLEECNTLWTATCRRIENRIEDS